MSFSVAVGLALAVATAFTSVVGFLYKHRGAAASPPVAMSRPVRSTLMLFRSSAYTLGLVIATASWGLHVGALSLLQLSVVQAVISGGLVFLAVLAERFFGFHLGRRQWIGLAVTAAGLMVLAVAAFGAGRTVVRIPLGRAEVVTSEDEVKTVAIAEPTGGSLDLSGLARFWQVVDGSCQDRRGAGML